MRQLQIALFLDWRKISGTFEGPTLPACSAMIRLMIPRHVCPTIRAAAFALASVAVVMFPMPVPAQSSQKDNQHDIIQDLLPDGAIPKELRVKPDQRERVVQKLERAKATAHGQRAQQAAFLLAALNVEYDRNRDYLFHALSGCNYPQIRYGCDDMTGEYLVYLFQHGHKEILAPLLKTSVDSYNAAGSEGLGAYFADLIQKSPETLVQAVSTLPMPMQKRVCEFAGLSDGGGLGAVGLAQARKKFRTIGGEVALRCLSGIEAANKPD